MSFWLVGLQDFQGKVIHTHDYRKPQGYEDKQVVIIGIGNSGVDSAVELSRVASQVTYRTVIILSPVLSLYCIQGNIRPLLHSTTFDLVVSTSGRIQSNFFNSTKIVVFIREVIYYILFMDKFKTGRNRLLEQNHEFR